MSFETDAISPPPAIELRDLRRDYGSVRALNGVSLRVKRGEVFGYVGANGAGKTTTLKILTGLLRPTSGSAAVCGHDVTASPLEAKARLGYVPESGALFEKLSPREYLTFVGQLHGLDDGDLGDRLERWLDYFGLAQRTDQRMTTFSKGMKQRICWIAALLHEPEVLILDEPLNGLDVETVARVKELMKDLAASGTTILYSSHLIDIVEKVCTRIALLHRGRVLASGGVADVVASAGTVSLEQALLSLSREEA